MRHLCSYCSSIFTLSEMVCSFLGRQSETGCCVLHSALHQKLNPEPVWSILSEYFCRSAEQSSAFNDPRTRTSPQQPGKMLEKSSSAITEALREHQGTHFSCSFHQRSQQSCKGKITAKNSSWSTGRLKSPVRYHQMGKQLWNIPAVVEQGAAPPQSILWRFPHPVIFPGPCQTHPGSKCLKSGLK